MFELWKGKGSMISLGSYRDVTCCSAIGKPFSVALRSSALSVLGAVASPGQTGSGLGGGGTDMARLWADAATHAAHLQRSSVALVFIDVAAAFASVVRELVLPLPSSADELAHRLLQRGFSHDDVYQCIAATEAHDMWTASGDHRHLANLLSAMHAHSWFTMDALAPCWRSTSGSLAGSSLGDLIFLLAFSRVMAKARAELLAQGLVATMPLETQPPFLQHHSATIPSEVALESVEYMDDVAIPVLAPADRLADSVAAVAGIMQSTFSAHGLVVNWSRGKSEAILHFRGPGAVEAQRKLHYEMGSAISFAVGGRAFTLQVVRDYRHLGSRIDLASALRADLSTKLAAMRAGVAGLRGRFFKNKEVEPKSKARVAQACLFSKGLFAAGTWPDLNVAEGKRVHTCIMKIYGLVSGTSYDQHVTAKDIIMTSGFTAPTLLVRLARLGLFSRVVTRAPPSLVCLLWAVRGAPSVLVRRGPD